MEKELKNASNLSFWKLINKFRIEIPIIQRDYAQGREEHKTVRVNFLLAIKNAILNSQELNLDFIYGNVVNENNEKLSVFQPLDGQQRLTTLYLLHWYAYKKELDEKKEINEKLSHFTYETRISSREFCRELVVQPINFGNEDESIREIIENSNWFFLSWKQDSTIRAMLKTIDDIHHEFKNISNLWELLTEKNIITFYYLILEDFGLSDDLYIKMNARGRLLTPFENLKAELQSKILRHKWEQGKKVADCFSLRIDTYWTDFVWNNFQYEHSVDISHMRFISTLVMINAALGKLAVKPEQRNEIIQKTQEDSFARNLVDYINEDAFDYICTCYELYSTIDLQRLNIPFCLWRHAPKKSITHEVLIEGNNPRTATSSYTHKVIFFAQTEYLIQRGDLFDETGFEDWIRVVRNIVSRGDIDSDGKRPDIVRSPDTFVGAINLVYELSSGCFDIYEYLSTTPVKSTFAKEQIREEIVKANIIQEYPQYKELLFKIEDNELLRGRIIFALQCAGYNGDINSINWDILQKVCNVFSVYFNSEDKLTDELRRTMLTIEVDGKYEFYHYWWSYWNVGQAVKRKLFVQFREIEYFIGSDYKEYFEKLVLLLTEKTYDEILREFIFPKDMPNWKRRIIREEHLLSGTSKYIAIPDDNSFCYLLKSRRPRDIDGGTKIE